MSSYIVGSLLGGGFVIVGVTITALRDVFVRRGERRATDAARLMGAMREYLAALDVLAWEVSDMPTAPKHSRVDRWLDLIAERTSFDVIIHIVVRILRRMTYGPRPDQLLDRLAVASSELRLIAPDSVLAIMRTIDGRTGGPASAGREWAGAWRSIRDETREAFRKELAAIWRLHPVPSLGVMLGMCRSLLRPWQSRSNGRPAITATLFGLPERRLARGRGAGSCYWFRQLLESQADPAVAVLVMRPLALARSAVSRRGRSQNERHPSRDPSSTWR